MILSILNVTLKSEDLVTLLIKTPAASEFKKKYLKISYSKEFFYNFSGHFHYIISLILTFQLSPLIIVINTIFVN